MGLTTNKITDPNGCQRLVNCPEKWQWGQRQCRIKPTIWIGGKWYCKKHSPVSK